MTDIAQRSTGSHTTTSDVPTSADTPTGAPSGTSGSEALSALVASLDASARTCLRLRRDGLVEVASADAVLGFVDWVRPVYVVYSGGRPAAAEEVAQRATLALAVEELLRRTARA